ncbi:hypothetical protein ACQY0O_003935 [Thecaphora frezii]
MTSGSPTAQAAAVPWRPGDMVGRRVSVGAHRGTVRFFGSVPPSEGEWLGIEWDDATRGKHDGVAADGTKYFDVRVRGSGSFLRPTASKLSFGSSLLEALKFKHLPAPDPAPPSHAKPNYSRRNLADIEIEAPNMQGVIQRTARLDRLRHVDLGGWSAPLQPPTHAAASAKRHGRHEPEYRVQVATALDASNGEQPGSIRQTCPMVEWLDLSLSLLPDWHEVVAIAAELPRLHCLNLNFNRFAPVPRHLPSHWLHAFPKLKTLNLDGTLIGWGEMLRLSPALPALELLRLGQNALSALAPDESDAAPRHVPFPQLETLILDDNLLTSWIDVVESLAVLPRLANLYLTKNLIEHIPAYTTGPRLCSLTHINLRSNPIATWQELDNLETWLVDLSAHGDDVSVPAASEQEQQQRSRPLKSGYALSIMPLDQAAEGATPISDQYQSPLLQSMDARTFRDLAIARLAHLQELDRTPITARDRRDGELFILGKLDQGNRLALSGVAADVAASLDLPVPEDVDGDDEPVALSLEQKRRLLPRYDELVRKYSSDTAAPSEGGTRSSNDAATGSAAAAEPGAAPDIDRGTLRAKLVEIYVARHHEAPRPEAAAAANGSSDEVGEGKKVKLLLSTPLRLAKAKLAKLASVRPLEVKALWAVKTAGEARIVVELDDLSKDLQWYGIGSGDEIAVVAETS